MTENEKIQEMHREIENWDDTQTNLTLAEWMYAKGYRKVERGEWIPVEKHRVESPKTECSLCGRDAVYQKVDGKWEFENFCPHCGADMRGNEK